MGNGYEDNRMRDKGLCRELTNVFRGDLKSECDTRIGLAMGITKLSFPVIKDIGSLLFRAVRIEYSFHLAYSHFSLFGGDCDACGPLDSNLLTLCSMATGGGFIRSVVIFSLHLISPL